MGTEWRKEPPDEVGYWLRINAIGKPTISWAVRIGGVLNVPWGVNGLVKHDHLQLKGWWWKPLPLPSELQPPDWEY